MPARTRKRFRAPEARFRNAGPRAYHEWNAFRLVRYRIQSIELYLRVTPPNRMLFVLGSGPAPATPPVVRLAHVRLVLRDAAGGETFGCAADNLSTRWLDKRSGRGEAAKLRELIRLVKSAREIYLREREFDDLFAFWLGNYRAVQQAGREQGQQQLSASFASALIERALIDAVCRAAGEPLFDMLRAGRLGFQPGRVHKRLQGFRLADHLSLEPRTRFAIRHTVGIADPLTDAGIPPEARVNDGLPESLEGFIERQGVTHFKVKISGGPEADLRRLARIWEVIPKSSATLLTLDANEAYRDLETFESFVHRLEARHLGLFQHIAFIEQPLPRHLTLDPKTAPAIRRLAQRKPLLIDEADGTLDAFARALEIGYTGVSHKNCKGFFKSLLNFALARDLSLDGKPAFQSGEDLQNLPIVPLHQDFAALGVLDIAHCERNGHHYNYGCSMLTGKEKKTIATRHRDLYEKKGDEYFLRIRGGDVETASLQVPGFGVADEPDWESMQPL